MIKCKKCNSKNIQIITELHKVKGEIINIIDKGYLCLNCDYQNIKEEN